MSRRPHVLVTRPRSSADALCEQLVSRGCDVSCAPLMEITLLPVAASDVEAAAGLVITSGNALKALAADPATLRSAMGLPIYCVGPATAEQAKLLGFTSVVEGPGNGAGLAECMITSGLSTLQSERRELLHLTTEERAYDLAGALRHAGIPVRTCIVYLAEPVADLPAPVVAALRKGNIDAVILMSPRTARIWGNVALKAGSRETLMRIRHICFSTAVAAGLSELSLPLAAIDIAASTDLEDILALTDRLVETTSSQ